MNEFGKGFTYCIGLFLAHAERKYSAVEAEVDNMLWFNGAADHLFELEVPDTFPLKAECLKWKEKCLHLRNAKN